MLTKYKDISIIETNEANIITIEYLFKDILFILKKNNKIQNINKIWYNFLLSYLRKYKYFNYFIQDLNKSYNDNYTNFDNLLLFLLNFINNEYDLKLKLKDLDF